MDGKNTDIFKISAALNDSRVLKHLTSTKAAQIGVKVLLQIESTLQMQGVPSPLKAALIDFQQMVGPCVAVAKKLGPSLCSPPKE